MSKQEDRIYIFSLYTIAYLRSKGCKVLEKEKTSTGKVAYWFERNPRTEFLLEQWQKNREMQKYINCVKQTKKEIFEM